MDDGLLWLSAARWFRSAGELPPPEWENWMWSKSSTADRATGKTRASSWRTPSPSCSAPKSAGRAGSAAWAAATAWLSLAAVRRRRSGSLSSDTAGPSPTWTGRTSSTDTPAPVPAEICCLLSSTPPTIPYKFNRNLSSVKRQKKK